MSRTTQLIVVWLTVLAFLAQGLVAAGGGLICFGAAPGALQSLDADCTPIENHSDRANAHCCNHAAESPFSLLQELDKHDHAPACPCVHMHVSAGDCRVEHRSSDEQKKNSASPPLPLSTWPTWPAYRGLTPAFRFASSPRAFPQPGPALVRTVVMLI